MSRASIPVDLFNPGQVFACLGFMELADVLLGEAEGGFDWSDGQQAKFRLSAAGDRNPVRAVLEFLVSAAVDHVVPMGYPEPDKKKTMNDDDDEYVAVEGENNDAVSAPNEYSSVFPAKKADALSLPVRLSAPAMPNVEVSHWSDGSTRNTFKLYSGNRSAERIVRAMLNGVRDKPKKNQMQGDLKYKGFVHLWNERQNDLVVTPFDVLTPLGGSFNFDPRGSWTALDVGYSPNTQKHGVAGSPLVHLLAACGLEHTRPVEFGVRQVRYCVWNDLLPVSLARVAFQGCIPSLLTRDFYFDLALSGKNKIATFAEEENPYEQ